MKKIIYIAIMCAFATACGKSDVTVNYPAQYPDTPVNLSPANNATGMPVPLTLSWSACKDPQGDPVFYDVVVTGDFGGYTQSETFTTQTTSVSVYCWTNSYTWQVTARDNHNNVSQGPIWTFTSGGK